MARNDHSPSGAPPEVILPASAGWISGPSGAEPVPAGQIRAGDVIVHDGRRLTVHGHPAGDWYCEDGEQIAGLAIMCRDGSARWTLYRRASEVLYRIVPDTNSN